MVRKICAHTRGAPCATVRCPCRKELLPATPSSSVAPIRRAVKWLWGGTWENGGLKTREERNHGYMARVVETERPPGVEIILPVEENGFASFSLNSWEGRAMEGPERMALATYLCYGIYPLPQVKSATSDSLQPEASPPPSPNHRRSNHAHSLNSTRNRASTRSTLACAWKHAPGPPLTPAPSSDHEGRGSIECQ